MTHGLVRLVFVSLRIYGLQIDVVSEQAKRLVYLFFAEEFNRGGLQECIKRHRKVFKLLGV